MAGLKPGSELPLNPLKRSTPCVGICSTTYGDLVCRGCKRYAHEIVQWNGYSNEQRDSVWARLLSLRAEAVESAVEIEDRARFDEAVASFRLPEDARWSVLAYELMSRSVRRDQPLEALGLMAREGLSVLALLKTIDAEIFRRSKARYEQSYRVPAE